MLCKEICIQCVNAFAVEQGHKNNRWGEQDKLRWEEEAILCPPKRNSNEWKLHKLSDPIVFCHCMFKHLVAAGMDHEAL